jgi:4'-phosphopantetheinyl transferase
LVNYLEEELLKIYHVPLVDISSWANELSDDLSWEEQERAARFVFEKDRESYIVCRGVLRRVLAKELSCDPRSIHFEYGPKGKPELGHGKLGFNLSHTRGFALIAVAPCSVGIDIEWERPIAISVMRASLTEKEMSQVQVLSHEERSRAFLHYWTKKEAILKGLGVGLDGPLLEYDLGHWEDRESIVFFPEQWTILNLEYFDKRSGYVAALAYEGAGLSVVHCFLKDISLGLAGQI